MIFSFINLFPSSSEENKFENVSPAGKTARFLAFFNSVFFPFQAYACFLLHFFFDVSFLHFQRIPDKTFPQLPMNMHYPVDCFGRFLQDVLQLFQFIVIELQFSSTVSRNLVRALHNLERLCFNCSTCLSIFYNLFLFFYKQNTKYGFLPKIDLHK